MNTCADCNFAHINDPKELRARTCFGLPPEMMMMPPQQRQMPDPRNPAGPPITRVSQQMAPVDRIVMASRPACSLFVLKDAADQRKPREAEMGPMVELEREDDCPAGSASAIAQAKEVPGVKSNSGITAPHSIVPGSHG